MPSITLVPHNVSARLTDPIVSPLAAIGVTPNMISGAGFVGNVAAGALAAGGHFLAAGIVMLFFSALDLLDGALARKTGTVTRFGAVFDSVLDRLSEAAVLGGLLFHYNETGGRTEEVALIYAAAVGSIMVSYVRARAEGIGLELREGLFTRAERVLLLGGALALAGVLAANGNGLHSGHDVLRWALWSLAILANATAVHRLYAVWQKTKDARR